MKYYLFIGRWCPFHDGHKYIVDSYVNNGKPVCIAVRDTDEKYTAEQRKRMIEDVYKDNPNVKVIIIPDIEGVCIGRDVGYCLMEVPEDIKKISGTNIRNGFVLWFTGLPSSGKTTISNEVAEKLKSRGYKVEKLDGDVVRKTLTADLGFSKKDRDENIKRVTFIAKLLSREGVATLCSFISPYRNVRESIRKEITNFIEVYVKCPAKICEERDTKGLWKKARAGEIKMFTGVDNPYEEPLTPEIVINTDKETIEESVDKVIEYMDREN